MGHFSGTLDSVKAVAGSLREAQPHAALSSTIPTAPLAPPTIDYTPSTSNVSTRSSPESPHHYPPPPPKDKGR